jgi:signal peptidase I
MMQPVLEQVPVVTTPHRQGVLPALQSLLYVLIISLGLVTFTVQPIRIPSGSMEPTLLVGDFLLLDKQAVANDPFFMPPSAIRRGDVVVFHDPVDDPTVHLVKRATGFIGARASFT